MDFDFLNKYHLNDEELPADLPNELDQFLHPKQHYREILVEDCWILGISDLGKGLLHRPGEQKWEEAYAKPLETTTEEYSVPGKSGETSLFDRWGKELKLNFNIDLGEPPIVNLSFLFRNSWHTQTIHLDELPLGYGIRPFFLCSCGYRAGKLYLGPNEYSFKCRTCARLYYESTSINPSSLVGAMGYRLHRIFKADILKTKVKRITYRGRYTRRARRVMALLGKNVAKGVAEQE